MSAAPLQSPSPKRPRVLGRWISTSPAVGFVAVAIYAFSDAAKPGTSCWGVFAVGAMAASAALIVGALGGFLFGLPRTLERPDANGHLATNTNLDQVSDWLTKIIVAIGLVELGKIANGVDNLATSLAPGLGGGDGVHAFAVGLMIYSVADGFLVGYLWTRIVVSIRLKEAAEDLARTAEVAAELLTAPPPPAPPALPPPPPAVGETATA